MSSGIGCISVPIPSAAASLPVSTQSTPSAAAAFDGVDALDARMGVRRHHHDAVALARQGDIVDIAAAPGDEALVLDPADRLADAELVDGCVHLSASPAAKRMAGHAIQTGLLTLCNRPILGDKTALC